MARERDLRETEDWYNQQRSVSVRSFASQSLTSLLASLQTRTSILSVHSEVRRAVLRRFPYLVYFQIEDKKVIILAVLDSRRDPEAHRRRTARIGADS